MIWVKQEKVQNVQGQVLGLEVATGWDFFRDFEIFGLKRT